MANLVLATQLDEAKEDNKQDNKKKTHTLLRHFIMNNTWAIHVNLTRVVRGGENDQLVGYSESSKKWRVE